MSPAQGTIESVSTRSRILLVDDQPQNVEMLSRRLERRGYEVITRDGAIDIEDVIVAERIELVLLDWMMPVRSGHEALLGIRERFDADHVPVIVVTALDDGDVVSMALEGGANDYVTKPVELRVLTARMKAQLDRRAAVLALHAARENLEKTVLERTRELRSANETLSAEIAEREAAVARAHKLARHDSLTGLANRRHFLEEFDRRLELVASGQVERFAMMSIDLDRFKPINDVHGHVVGDEILQVIARRVAQCLPPDSFTSRIGGDEFAVLIGGAAERDGHALIADRIIREICAPIVVNGLKLTVGASVGIAVCPNDGQTVGDLLSRCDAAMLRAKDDRGTYTFFDSSIDDELKERAALEAELRAAIPAGDIVPYFQPVVDLCTGEASGYEVLARWRHASRGMIPPSQFIPVAEESGLVDTMFWALLAQACRTALQSRDNFILAVNISPSQIRDQWFPEKVLRTLTETSFPARRLEIEVTESAMIGDIQRAKTSLMSLKNQGVKIALDDFGTGYSSLLLLRALPIDKLKIDRSFVSNMLSERENATIVGALVGLGKALGLNMTAEGVEDIETAQALRDLGCPLGQGYVFGAAAPLPAYEPIALRASA